MAFARIANSTREILIEGVMINDDLQIEKGKTRSSGGHDKIVTSGARYHAVMQVRRTSPQYKDLIDMLTDESDVYFFTPPLEDGIVAAGKFPMSVDITPQKDRGAGGGGRKHYLTLDIEGTEFTV